LQDVFSLVRRILNRTERNRSIYSYLGSLILAALPDQATLAKLMPAQPHDRIHVASSVWRPLRSRTFRNLLIADVFSDVGTFMQSVGAAWLMVSLNAGPMYVALTQAASALPFFLFALPAGAVGDIVDRRKLILFTETWMAAVAIILAVVTIEGWITPWLLLALTFALSAGDAFETPTWRAVLPELVPKEDLEAASALNGIEFNLARAVGPGLAGALIATVGISAAFVANALSFIGVLAVVARWQRPKRRRTTPAERVIGATLAAVRYVRYSPVVRAPIIRSGMVMFFASALLALLPTVAKNVSQSPIAFGMLLGCFGAGAIIGAFAMQSARSRWSTEVVASSGVVILGLTTIAVGAFRELAVLCFVLLVGGAAWITFISLVSALVQKLAPNWVRARVLAVFILVFQGGMAGGAAVWGVVAQHAGVQIALMWAGLGGIATIGLGLRWRLPDATIDVSPWNHWRMPAIVRDVEIELESGPVLVTVEYVVSREHASEFIKAMHRYGRIRRRDGASRWGVFRDVEDADRYLEIFLVNSWAEHLRQHERITQADRALEERLHRCAVKEPAVRHLIYAAPNN
jgi:MFS family permease